MLHGELQQRILDRRRTGRRCDCRAVLVVLMHHDLVVMQLPSDMMTTSNITFLAVLSHCQVLLLLLLLVHHLLRLHDKTAAIGTAASGRRRRHGLHIVLHDLIMMLLLMMVLMVHLVMDLVMSAAAATIGQ